MALRTLRLFPRLLAFVLTAGALTAHTPTSGPRFAHEKSDLRADPAARFGRLENGLHYVVLPNAEPKDRVSLRLVIFAGSFQETEEQRGVAHFLEHMAFNGSKHYPPGTMIEFFQRMGMSFGGDSNAYTAFDHTNYMLELPDTKPATLAEGFKVLSDYADGLLLLDDELEKERGIILSEKRARDSVEYRQRVAEFEFVLGNTLIAKRLPIGLESVIQKAPRAAFADFYDTWYRPSRMGVIAVGDFDPEVIEKHIVDTFSSLQPRGPGRADPELGSPDVFSGIRAFHHHEPEAGSSAVCIQTVDALSPEPDNAARRIRELPRRLAAAMLSRRIDILSKQENAPFISGHASIHDGIGRIYRNGFFELTCKPELWAETLAVAEQELRRALQYGFQPAELTEARANLLNALEQAARTAPSRRSPDLAAEIVAALVQDDVLTTPADDLALLKPALEKITVDDCNEALRAAFANPGRFVSVLGNARLGVPGSPSPEEQILAVYEKTAATPVEPPPSFDDLEFAYTDFGGVGEVASRQHVEDLDVHLVRYANDVRLNLKATDFEAGKIRVSVRVGAGQLIQPRDKPGLAEFAEALIAGGGLGRHSVDELQRILAGKNVVLSARVENDAIVFTAFTHRDDLLLQLQLIAAVLVDAGYRDEAVRIAHKNYDSFYTRIAHLPDGPLRIDVPRLLASGDTRFGLPTREELFARTPEEVRVWLNLQFTRGPIEIALVGDLETDAAIDAVARTFGALPPREPKPGYDDERRAAFPEPFSRTFTVPSEIPKGYVALFWPTTDSRDIGITRRLSVLAEVLNDRLRVKIREELGDAYSPDAGSDPSDTYHHYGYITALVAVDPAKAATVTEAILEIADDLAAHGVSEDELERAKNPILTSLREAGRNNAYWLQSVLSRAQEQPQRLDWRRSIDRDFASISKSEIDALAKQYLPVARAFRITSLPVKP